MTHWLDEKVTQEEADDLYYLPPRTLGYAVLWVVIVPSVIGLMLWLLAGCPL